MKINNASFLKLFSLLSLTILFSISFVGLITFLNTGKVEAQGVGRCRINVTNGAGILNANIVAGESMLDTFPTGTVFDLYANIGGVGRVILRTNVLPDFANPTYSDTLTTFGLRRDISATDQTITLEIEHRATGEVQCAANVTADFRRSIELATGATTTNPSNVACNDEDTEEQRNACRSCLNQRGLWTAIGCIDPTPQGIVTGIIRITFGIMGGVALIQLIIAGIQYMSGDQAKIQQAREKLQATFFGLALIVFSVLILRVIGINVLDVLPIGSV